MLLPFCVPNPSLSPCSLAIVVLYYFLSFTAAASLPRSLDPYGNDFRKYTQTISESTGEVTRTSSPGVFDNSDLEILSQHVQDLRTQIDTITLLLSKRLRAAQPTEDVLIVGPKRQEPLEYDIVQRCECRQQEDTPRTPVTKKRPHETLDNLGYMMTTILNASLALFGSMTGGLLGSWLQAHIQRRAEAAMKMVEERAKAAAEQAADAVAQRVENLTEGVRVPDGVVRLAGTVNDIHVDGVVEATVEGVGHESRRDDDCHP